VHCNLCFEDEIKEIYHNNKNIEHSSNDTEFWVIVDYYVNKYNYFFDFINFITFLALN